MSLTRQQFQIKNFSIAFQVCSNIVQLYLDLDNKQANLLREYYNKRCIGRTV